MAHGRRSLVAHGSLAPVWAVAAVVLCVATLARADEGVVVSSYTLGVRYLQAGDSASAVAYFRESIEREPRRAGAYVELARIYQQREQWEDAEAVLSHGARFCGNSIEVWVALADLYEARGRSSDARGALRHALDLAPHDRILLLRVASLDEQLGRFLEALALYRALRTQLLADPATSETEVARVTDHIRALEALTFNLDPVAAACTDPSASRFARAIAGCIEPAASPPATTTRKTRRPRSSAQAR